MSDFLPAVACISSHPHGDGVVVESVCHGQDLQLNLDVDAISSSLKGSLVRLAKHCVGCRVAQAALRDASLRAVSFAEPGQQLPPQVQVYPWPYVCMPPAALSEPEVIFLPSEVPEVQVPCSLLEAPVNADVPGAEGQVIGAKGRRHIAEVRAEVSGAKGPACVAEVTGARGPRCSAEVPGAKKATPESLQWLVSELQGQILSSCRHLHANFVLHVCIELLVPHFDAVSVAVHVGDCRVLHWLIELGSCKPQLTQPVDSILGIVEKVARPLTQQAESTLCSKLRSLDAACVAKLARSLNEPDVVSTCLGPNPNAVPMLVSDSTALKKFQTA